MSSACESTLSVTNSVASAAEVPAWTWSQSSPGAAPLTALPSSSKRPSSWTARAAGASANAAYCSSTDRMKSADQDSARRFLVFGLKSPRAPREVMESSSLWSCPSDDLYLRSFAPALPLELPLPFGRGHRDPTAVLPGGEEYRRQGGERY